MKTMPRPYVQPIPTWSANKWCFENGLADSPIEHGCCLKALHDRRSNYKDPFPVTKICTTTEGVQQCNIMYPAPTPALVDNITDSVKVCARGKVGLSTHTHTPKRRARKHITAKKSSHYEGI